MKNKFIALLFFAVALVVPCARLGAQEKQFKFVHRLDAATRILSTVEEDIYVNGRLDHRSIILNRVTTNITTVNPDGSGTVSGTFMTSEQSSDVVSKKGFSWSERYLSVFQRDEQGHYTIGDEYFMPVVRDVPVFPDYPVKVGESWTAEGHEAHDLRQSFGIDKPFKIPFTAKYTYKGELKEKDGRILDIINVEYTLYYESPNPTSMPQITLLNTPRETLGYSNQTLYWDNKLGVLDSYNEKFRIVIVTYAGTEFIFEGNAKAETDEVTMTNTLEAMRAMQEAVDKLGLENVEVKRGDFGLTVSIENIEFLGDSAVLQESEKKRLNDMLEVFRIYGNDLLITGHTALAGTEEGRNHLSVERARVVAEYLISKGVRNINQVFTEGKGADVPIASNDTPEGRARNRRVEITFLDN